MANTKNGIVGAFLSYRSVLVRALLRLSVKPADVDDILQETLARTLSADSKNQLEFPKSYLYTVARHVAFEESERRSREVQSEIDEAVLDADAAPLDEALHYQKMLEVFQEAMSSLPEAQQRAILLRRIYGLSHKDIAAKMGVSISSVEKYFAQGMKRCQDVLSRRGYSLERTERTTATTADDRTASSRRNVVG